MSEQRLLYFSAEQHTLYRSRGSTLELEARFTADEAGVEAFRDYLRTQRGALFSLLADLAGEDFHEDQIPLLRGGDRETVVQRRLAQRYRDTRLATALSLGPVLGGERRNERLLLASFTNTQQIAPWLDALDAAGARLAGVYSVPLLAPALAARLGVRDGRCFVVSANRAGLRQSFVENGRLRFARLERITEMVPQALAMFVRSETQRLAQYLATLRALPREGAPVQVLVVAPPGQEAVFEQVLVSDSRLLFKTIDGAAAARAAGLAQVPEGALAESLYLHLAAKKPPRDQFATRADTRRFFIWQLQRGIIAAGAAVFALSVLVAGARWLDAFGVRDQAESQARQSELAADQYQRITATFPVTQTSTENLRVAVVEFRRLAERGGFPEQAFVHVSRVLQDFPQVELDGINWSVGKPLGPALRPGGAAPFPGAAKPDPGGDSAVIMELTGRVNATQRDNYRGITAQVQRFAGALASSGYEVLATKLPFDITSEGTLTGDIGGADSGEAPRFTITLARRLP
jgi:hypothetical protein